MRQVSNLKRSRWSLVLCFLAALLLAVFPLGAAAKVYLSGGGDDQAGDPVDSNDLGGAGGSGGSDDDIHDSLNTTPIKDRYDRPTLFGFYIILAPSGSNLLGFELLFIVPVDTTDAEGAYAR
jgi:hypothetical protein